MNPERIVEASIIGTHCFQTGTEGGDSSAFSAACISDDDRTRLVSAHVALAGGDESAIEILEAAGIALDPRLPVNAVTAVLGKAAADASSIEVRAWANLVQTALEIERDGTLLQDLLSLYAKLGVLKTAEQFGIEDSNERFLELGAEMAAISCKGPYKTDAAEFQINLRKIANWSVKHLEVETPATFADAIAVYPEVAEALPAMRAMEPERFMVVGHSYTMHMNWSTYASFTDTAAALIGRENPGFTFKRIGEGGMVASRAREAYFEECLAWKPDRVLFVIALRDAADYDALEEMASRLAEASVQVTVPDRVHPDPSHWASPDTERLHAISSRTGLAVLQVGTLMDKHPEKDDFLSLDGVHCRSSYHKLMAAELAKYLAGAREAGSA